MIPLDQSAGQVVQERRTAPDLPKSVYRCESQIAQEWLAWTLLLSG